MRVIYIEETLRAHPRVERIVQRFPKSEIIFCQNYREIFNRKWRCCINKVKNFSFYSFIQ